jgi:hypothetical protein
MRRVGSWSRGRQTILTYAASTLDWTNGVAARLVSILPVAHGFVDFGAPHKVAEPRNRFHRQPEAHISLSVARTDTAGVDIRCFFDGTNRAVRRGMTARSTRWLLAFGFAFGSFACGGDASAKQVNNSGEDGGEHPPSLTFEQCREQDGTIVLDPGGGRIYHDGCPDQGILLGWLASAECQPLCGEGGICCRPPAK